VSRKAAGTLAVPVLGCMNFGGRTPADESRRILEAALRAGVRAFDTANMYGEGASESIVGEVLAGAPDVFVATKVGLLPVKGGVEGLSRDVVLKSADAGLKRLRRDSVDILYLHAPDRRTPLAETLGAMQELVASGRVRHVGMSNYSAWETCEAFTIADSIGLARPRIAQVLLNAAVRQVKLEFTSFAAKHGVHLTAYNPLAGGLFARRPSPGDAPPPGSRFALTDRYRHRYWTGRMFTFADALHTLADAHRLTAVDLAYGWLAAHPAVDSILLGPATVPHLDAALASLGKPLPQAVRKAVVDLQRDFDGTDARYAR